MTTVRLMTAPTETSNPRTMQHVELRHGDKGERRGGKQDVADIERSKERLRTQ